MTKVGCCVVLYCDKIKVLFCIATRLGYYSVLKYDNAGEVCKMCNTVWQYCWLQGPHYSVAWHFFPGKSSGEKNMAKTTFTVILCRIGSTSVLIVGSRGSGPRTLWTTARRSTGTWPSHAGTVEGGTMIKFSTKLWWWELSKPLF